MIRVGQADSQPKGCTTEEPNKINTAMLFDTFLFKEFEAEAEGEPHVFDAQTFQNTRSTYNLRSQAKGPFTTPIVPKDRQVPLDPTTSNNPP